MEDRNKQQRHNFWQAAIFCAILVLSELHTYWEHSTVVGKWILIYPWAEPIRLQNYIYDNSVMVNWILLSIFAYRHGKRPTQFGTWLLGIFIVWKIVNVPLYWYNYRTFGYGWVYFGLVVFGVLTYWQMFVRRK